MLIFLDFDGVLRRAQSPKYRFERDCLDSFQQAFRSIGTGEIVIASSWKDAFSLDNIRNRFASDVALRICGATPSSKRLDGRYRYREVCAYLSRHGWTTRPWIAIDDDSEHYPPRLKNLVLTDPARGFDADAAQHLLALALTNAVVSNYSAEPESGRF